MRKLRFAVSVFLSVVLLFTFAAAAAARSTADAVSPVDTSAVCSLKLDYSYDGVHLSGIQISLFQVADLSEDFLYTPRGAFADHGIVFNGIKTQAEWQKLASTIAAYIALDEIEPDAQAVTGENGIASFTGLKAGMYFADMIRFEDSGTVYFFERVLVSVPEVNEDGSWNYNVTAVPKHDVYTPKDDEIIYRVNKLWSDAGYENKRPASVDIVILKNGAKVETVTLNQDNNWSYAWVAPDDGAVWQVAENDVPDGYTVTVSQNGNVLNVTNKYKVPGPPDNPPVTGDVQNTGLWLFIMVLSGIALIVLGVYEFRSHRRDV